MTFLRGVAGMSHPNGVDGACLSDKRVHATNAIEPGHQLTGTCAVIGIFEQDFAQIVTDIIDVAIFNIAQPNEIRGGMGLV